MRVRLKQQRLIELIANSGLSQNHWAIRIGLSRGHWSAIVNGRHPFPSPRTREGMLEAFNVEFDELFEVESGPAEGADSTFQAAIADRYLIDKEIGHGGMGAVYRARDLELEREVALKVIRPDLTGHSNITRRFKQELILARQVTHKNVIRIFDLGEAEGTKFISMEYIDGRDLSSIQAERGKLPPEEAAAPLLWQP